MRDAVQRDQLCIDAHFLKFGNPRLCWAKRHDLLVAGVNRQNRSPPR